MSTAATSTDRIHRCLHGVAYEIFLQSFFDSNADGIGDINGLRAKLNYLVDLGITLIWLMPIHPAKTYHKYDVEDYLNIHADYGTMEDFRCLLDECHQRDILVILDLVANHTSYDHPWFRQAQSNPKNEYRDYYIWADSERVERLGLQAFDTPDRNAAGLWHQVGPESEHFDWEEFEKKMQMNVRRKRRNLSEQRMISKSNTYYAVFDPRMPDLNYDCKRVQEEMCRIGRRWLEFGVDGFRLDAAKYFHKPPQLKLNLSWWKKFRQEMLQINPSVYLIGEVWDSSTRIAPYFRSLDSLFNFELAEMLVSCLLNEGNGSTMLQSYTRLINQYRRESEKTDVLDAIFLSNHDQNRIMSTLENHLPKAKLAAALLLTLPGLPFIYYGEEIGMLGTTPHDKYRREPVLWSSNNKQGQTIWLEPKYTKISNGCIPLDEQLIDSNSLVNHYKKLIHLRRRIDILSFGTIKPIVSRIRSLCLFERIYDNQSIFLAHNLGSRKQQIIIPDGFHRILFSTQNEECSALDRRQFNLDAYSSVIVQ